jgi:protein-arginine kinase activator protein McsA
MSHRVPIRAKPGFADHLILTCPDCLRTFRAEVAPAEVEGTAACYHCDARVPFRIESSAPQG